MSNDSILITYYIKGLIILMQDQGLPSQQEVAQSGYTVLHLFLHNGEESVIVCLTFGKEESVYQS